MTYTILVVEDDNGLQKYLKELLLDNAYNVQVAGDGIQALEQLGKMEPDVDEGHDKKLLHSVRGFGYVIRE